MSRRQRFHRLLLVGAERQALLLEAAVWLIVARLSILVIPFRFIGKLLGPLTAPGTGAAPGAHVAEIQAVSWAVERAAGVLPVRLVCLPRALAATGLLDQRDIPCQLHFGVHRKPATKDLGTHAWVDSEGIEVTGFPEAHECVEIARFSR